MVAYEDQKYVKKVVYALDLGAPQLCDLYLAECDRIIQNNLNDTWNKGTIRYFDYFSLLYAAEVCDKKNNTKTRLRCLQESCSDLVSYIIYP